MRAQPFAVQRPVGSDRAAEVAPAQPLIHTGRGAKRRRIPGHDLGRYERPVIPGNRNLTWRAAWYLINALFFQGAILSLIPGSWKTTILRGFGARVGKGFVCKPRVSIKYPWFLEIGDHVWIGELAWIDNHCTVRMGSSVCISQGACIFTGNHDWNDPAFGFFCRTVEIGDGAWIAAFARVPPGTRVPAGTVIGSRSEWMPER